MPASFRFSSSLGGLLTGAGALALLLLILVLATGGFAIELGAVRVTVFDWRRPAVWATLSWALAAWLCGRRVIPENLSTISRRLERHALAIAIVVSASAAGAGVAFGTHAAAASDASAYVSQAELLSTWRVGRAEPLARQVTWPDATWAFSPLGYRPGLAAGELVPTYPPGLPLAMALARRAGEWGPYLVVPLFGALAVFLSYRLGAALHSQTSGVVAALLLCTSPVFLFQLVQPMSDVPATALWALALRLALSPRPGARVAAGAATGLALLTRPNLLPLAGVAALVAAGWPFRPWPGARDVLRRWGAFALGAAPAVAGLLFLQWRNYGDPLASGHGSFSDFFTLVNVWPNARDYAGRLVRGEAPAILLAACSGLLLYTWQSRPHERSGRIGTCARLTTAVAAALLVCYLPYGVFPDWSYLRFLLPVFPLAAVCCGALLTDACARLQLAARGPALVVATAVAGSANTGVASAEQAFNLRHYEARYRTVGRYLDASLPASAVIIAEQESGSASFYTRRPIVRWDLLRVDLDAAVASLVALDRTPVLLVEDWEAPRLRARFPDSRLAALDWAPRADIGTDTRVKLFDPADRNRSAGTYAVDRFP